MRYLKEMCVGGGNMQVISALLCRLRMVVRGDEDTGLKVGRAIGRRVLPVWRLDIHRDVCGGKGRQGV